MTIKPVSKATVDYIHEQLTGVYKQHVDLVPNNPSLFNVIKAHCNQPEKDRAMTRLELSVFLSECSEALKE